MNAEYKFISQPKPTKLEWVSVYFEQVKYIYNLYRLIVNFF